MNDRSSVALVPRKAPIESSSVVEMLDDSPVTNDAKHEPILPAGIHFLTLVPPPQIFPDPASPARSFPSHSPPLTNRAEQDAAAEADHEVSQVHDVVHRAVHQVH